MVKKQKSVSVPLEMWEATEQLFEDYKALFDTLEITSPSELLRVMAKLGRTLLLDVLEGRKPLTEVIEEIRKARSQKGETQKKQKAPSF